MTTELIARFSDFPAHHAACAPDAPAVVFDELRWTYRDLHERVEQCARALLAFGISKGDRVAMLSTPRPEYLVIFVATARIGAIWVGLNPVQQLDEYRYILADAKPKMLFALGSFRHRNNRDILIALRREVSCLEQLVICDEDSSGFLTFDAFLEAGFHTSREDLAKRVTSVLPEDVALIVYTSGSTGVPKGAMLTQRNIAYAAAIYFRQWPLNPLRVVCNLPISHIACCTETVAFALAGRGTIAFHEYFDAEVFLRTVQEECISWILLIPTMFHRILAVSGWDRYGTRSLEVVLFGGAAMPRDMVETLERLGGKVFTCWGLTESTAAVTFTDWTDNAEILSQSVGKAASECEVAIMNKDQQLLPDGEVGEIVVRGPCVFAGYFGMPDASQGMIDRQGWLHSGDVGRLDSEGRFYMVGRMKEMFKSGGYNVYPREVEIAIESHPAVSMAAVVSVADPVYQEVGYAFVLRKPGRELASDDILRHCRERLANYKIPKRCFIRDVLPMLAIGKIDKIALRTEAAGVTGDPMELYGSLSGA